LSIQPSSSRTQIATLEFDVKFAFDANAYTGATVFLGDQLTLGRIVCTTTSRYYSGDRWHSQILRGERNGTLNPTTTANGDGHWFSANGDITAWNNTAKVFSEFHRDNFTFFIRQCPGTCEPGDKFIMKQALVYVQAKFVFHYD